MIKYYVSEAMIAGFVVTWAGDDSVSSVVAIELNEFKTNEVVVADGK
jgi:hypothetical protein